MKTSIATITLRSITAYSQSRYHEEPFLEGENHLDYDKRTWRHKLHTEEREGKRVLVLPAHGLHQALAAGAKYSQRKIPNARGATWTKKFEAGVAFLENPVLDGIDPDEVRSVRIFANLDGKRGGSSRGMRMFPQVPSWRSTFDIHVLDPIITEVVLREFLDIAGMFIGIGRFRPQNTGMNGRFFCEEMVWQDNRQFVPKAA